MRTSKFTPEQMVHILRMGDSGVPVARCRGRRRPLTKPWRCKTAWMVLLAGMRISPANRRTSSSRILRAPQCGFCCLSVTIRLSIWDGSWLA